MNREIIVNLEEKSYKIRLGKGEINYLRQFLAEKNYSKIFIISDEIVANLHLEKITSALETFVFKTVIIKPLETSKSFPVLANLCEEILQNNLDRQSLIIAFGGGVVGDLAGFAASILLRGIDFIQVPTTLLAAVDSSVGGKTAINCDAGKNLIGSFYQPKLVIIDADFLATLPEREFRAGYAEILKYGLIYDRNFFDFLDKHLNEIFTRKEEIISKIIEKSCQIKAEIVSQDEKEHGIRALLNFGHTFGHIFESETKYSNKILHGEAVGIGMLMAAKMSYNLGIMSEKDFTLIKNHILKSDLNFDLENLNENWRMENLINHLYKDKKTERNNPTFILLSEIGKAVIKKSVSLEEFKKTIIEYLPDIY